MILLCLFEQRHSHPSSGSKEIEVRPPAQLGCSGRLGRCCRTIAHIRIINACILLSNCLVDGYKSKRHDGYRVHLLFSRPRAIMRA